MTGVPDDPSERPTQMAGYGSDGSPQALHGEPDPNAGEPDSAMSGGAAEPWYRNRVLLALWALIVALLVTLLIYGIVELSRGGGETGGPATTTSSTTSTSSSSTSPTTTTETPPPSETPEQSPEQAPPPANGSPAPAEPPQRHHHPHIPSTIPLPHTVITLPHGF